MTDINEGKKLGLALSGGGFRAAFFHIGVLAQMARLRMLRHVEVISTVSGGSIIGALYYMRLKEKLEEYYDRSQCNGKGLTAAACMSDEIYIEIVKRIEKDFLEAVQKNIRMRTYINLLDNLRMLFPWYSRSDRIAKLFDHYFYRPSPGSKLSGRSNIEMRDLLIQPKGASKSFHPETGNAAREDKVPILSINATTLNTGRNWRFEAAAMGAPPLRTDPVAWDVDKNVALARPCPYDEIIERQQDVRLGDAVAASACVPGIFPPLAISDLYPDGIRLQLVDGGVNDNQGIGALIDYKCSYFVISDASGQLQDEGEPATGIFSVLQRTNDILMDRVREQQLMDLKQKYGGAAALMHLQKELPRKEVPYYYKKAGSLSGAKKHWPDYERGVTGFDVDFRVQARLARIRTDLDSFTEVEAYSLMADSYLMSESELRTLKAAMSKADPPLHAQWQFEGIRDFLRVPNDSYLDQLDIASKKVGKVFRQHPELLLITALVLVSLLSVVGYLFWEPIQGFLYSPAYSLLLMLLAVALGLVLNWASRSIKVLRFLRSPVGYVYRAIIRVAIPIAAAFFIWLYLETLDRRLFIKRGTLAKL